jgi:hypothetical protein
MQQQQQRNSQMPQQTMGGDSVHGPGGNSGASPQQLRIDVSAASASTIASPPNYCHQQQQHRHHSQNSITSPLKHKVFEGLIFPSGFSEIYVHESAYPFSI